MAQTTFVDRYALFWATLWGFVSWYVIERPVRIFERYWDYATALAEVFAFGFLLRTLLAPWKNITDTKKKPGFDLGEWGERLVLNMTSRVIGMIVRIFALVFGVILELTLLAGLMVFIIGWFVYPALFVMGVTFLTRSFF